MIVAVAGLKGGVGKTTSSVYLAHELGSVVLIDADPQGSAVEWAALAQEAGTPLSTPVISLPTPDLGNRLPTATNLVIDSPPGDLRIVTAAIEAADIVLVPTAPSALDVLRVWATLDLAKAAGKPSAVLLVRTRRTRSVAQAVAGIEAEGATVLSTHIPLREGLALSSGRPITQTYGYEHVAVELRTILGGQATT